MLIVVLATVASAVMFWSMYTLDGYVADKVYLSDYAKKKALDLKYEKFNRYVKESNVKGTDKKRLKSWLKKEKYTQLFVWDNKRDVFSGGWLTITGDDKGSLSESASLEENKEEIVFNKGTKNRIGSESFKEDIYNRYVRFADGKYYTYINVNEEQYWYKIMSVVTGIMTVFTFLFVIMFYNTMVIRRIKRFSNEVRKISGGDLQGEIKRGGEDEIGLLAVSVDNMRNSLLKTMQNEKSAWDANAALITAMSHDVRTPLTSLIGYLDIIEGGKFRRQEDLLGYIHSCREKAFQLKELSDELFGYFLVFGAPERDEQLEPVDAGILFRQLLGEHVAEVLDYDRNITLDYDIPEDVWVKVNVSSLRRLFDNLFSNILKYASKDAPVRVSAVYDNGKAEILFQNKISKDAKQREGTGIGVKTCKKICEDMRGTFSAREEGGSYITLITFPIEKIGGSCIT